MGLHGLPCGLGTRSTNNKDYRRQNAFTAKAWSPFPKPRGLAVRDTPRSRGIFEC